MLVRRLRGSIALTACVGASTFACGSEDSAPALRDPRDAAVAVSADADPRPAEAGEARLSDAGDATRPAAAYPIVLLHGMGGFGELRVGPIGATYFRGVVQSLKAAGERDVFATEVTPYAPSEQRARELIPQLDEILRVTGAAKVNLIAHSQGGIDARLLASPTGLKYGDKIASIVTVSTPHRGSRIADLTLATTPGGPVDTAVNAFLGVLQRSVYDVDNDPAFRAQLRSISEAGMRSFNAQMLDAPGVHYESYAGRTNLRTGIGVCDGGDLPNEPTKLDAAGPELITSTLLLEVGLPLRVNDGLVTVESAKWGTFVRCIPADHANEIGLSPGVGFDHLAFYKDVVARLRARGL
jgi:triacylglycerol lipase